MSGPNLDGLSERSAIKHQLVLVLYLNDILLRQLNDAFLFVVLVLVDVRVLLFLGNAQLGLLALLVLLV